MSLPPSWSQDNRREIDDLFASLRVARGLRRPRGPEPASAQELNEVKQELARLREDFTSIVEEREDAKEQRDRAQASAEAFATEVRKLRDEFAVLAGERDQAKADAASFSAEVAKLREELRSAVEALKPSQAIEETKLLLTALTGELGAARKEREQAVAESASLAQAVARLQQELLSLKSELGRVQAERREVPPPPPPPRREARARPVGDEFSAMRDFLADEPL